MAQRNLNAQHSEVITVERKAVQEKKTLSVKKQTHPHIYHDHLIGSRLGHFNGLFNKEKLHQNTLVSI